MLSIWHFIHNYKKELVCVVYSRALQLELEQKKVFHLMLPKNKFLVVNYVVTKKRKHYSREILIKKLDSTIFLFIMEHRIDKKLAPIMMLSLFL